MSKLLDSLLPPSRLAECLVADAIAAKRSQYVRDVRQYAALVRGGSLSQAEALARFNQLQAQQPEVDPKGALFGMLVSLQPAHEYTYVERHAHLELQDEVQ